jgi:DNA repair exonuclease SbcCD ATPase subunit
LQLEESNLFLIQNCQDTEQQLEELRQQFSDTSAAMQRQTESLNEQMAGLQALLSAEEAKAAALRRKITDKASAAAPPPSAAAGKDAGGVGDSDWAVLERMLPELRQRIIEVYERCGFKATASSDTISMLTQLEGRLEGLLATLSGLDPEYVVTKEKEKDKDRRARVREARLKAQQEGHEERQLKMLQRAQAPVVKREGKPVMFRSQPFPKKVVIERPDPAAEQEKEDAKHFQ